MAEIGQETVASKGTPAVLFANVSGWTELCARRGEPAAVALRSKLFSPLKGIVATHRGWVVKSLGDALMCMFDSVSDAARAACEMQKYATAANRNSAERLPLRMGIHAGQVVITKDDVEGTTVDIAARVGSSSKPERILLTTAAANLLPEDLSLRLLPWSTEALKGVEEMVGLMELQWRTDASRGTGVAPAAAAPSAAVAAPKHSRLTLRCEGHVRTLEPGTKPLTFGRGEHNDLVITDPELHVSGSHGKIEIRGGTMVLTDDSRNGIYISFEDDKFFMVQKQLVLHKSGRMALGQAPGVEGTVFAEFEVE